MKIQPQFAAAIAALLITSNAFPVCAANADKLPEATAFSQNNAQISGSALPEEWETVSSGDAFSSSGDTSEQEPSAAGSERTDITVLDEAPVFSAHIEYFHGQGYVVRGTFTEFLPGTSLVQPLYSLDGEVWQTCQTTWNLQWLNRDTADDLKQLQNQTCLHSTHEPLASYLAGQLDCFYLKLQITLENGITYETRAAVIDRGDPQPLPEEFTPVADFVPAMRIRQWTPFKRYGQYQITVSDDAVPEDISALLPDTLPISVNLMKGADFATDAIVNCPVTWKPLSLSQLTAGESVTIEDAAEEIIIPAGTLLNTPNGIFQLSEPLGIDHDEIRLVLNVVAENAEPTGVLSGYFGGLELSFNLKPTGATAIQAYTLSDGESTWVEIPDPLLPEEVNAPSSTANSTYTSVLKNSSEPYQSYLTAWNAGDEPAPFWVGLKIEGGVYDGQQLILAWPDTYELPARLPVLNGSGGNECNAGSDNKNDSTSEGQRPGLPQNPPDEQDAQEPEPPQDLKDEPDAQEPEPPQDLKDEQNTQEPEPLQDLKDEQNTQESELPRTSEYKPVAQQPKLPQILNEEPNDRQMEQLRPLEDGTDEHTARPNDSFIQVSIAETMPILIAGAENPASIPAVIAETGSPAWEIADHRTEHGLHRLILPAAAAIATVICIVAAIGKVTAGSISGRISGKIIHVLYRLLHLK